MSFIEFCELGDVENVKFMILNSPKEIIDKRDRGLIQAIYNDREEVVDLLLDNFINLNISENLLKKALNRNNKRILTSIVHYLTNSKGSIKKAFKMAVEMGDKELIDSMNNDNDWNEAFRSFIKNRNYELIDYYSEKRGYNADELFYLACEEGIDIEYYLEKGKTIFQKVKL
eukprot:TRINITY_DN16878_c0_g1_i1.p1 TRINITY_DN16878_c0_g1~~TRINITY_DN16878_c0_g1_i1.p1  ORF type:complete len:172 (+),score=35.62 TRINITY_DN16878_c0_g1_i1:2-517(+)